MCLNTLIKALNVLWLQIFAKRNLNETSSFLISYFKLEIILLMSFILITSCTRCSQHRNFPLRCVWLHNSKKMKME